MRTPDKSGVRGKDALTTWPVHDAAMAVMPVLVRAELHLRQLAGKRADTLSWRLLHLFETLVEISGDVERYARHWDDPALIVIAAPLTAVLAAYERAGDGVASEQPQRPRRHDAEERRHASAFAAVIVRETDGERRINAGATWEHACTAVASGADPREVTSLLSREVTNDNDWRDLLRSATDSAAGWQAVTAPGTLLRAALALETDDGWWTGPGDSPVHVSASSLLALVESHRALMQAVGRLIPAAEAHAADAMTLADEVADDPESSADEKQERHLHATETELDIGFAHSTLEHAKGMH